MKCAYQHGELENAIMSIHRPDWIDDEGHCKLDAVGEFDGEQYCLGHLTSLKEEAERLQEWLKEA